MAKQWSEVQQALNTAFADAAEFYLEQKRIIEAQQKEIEANDDILARQKPLTKEALREARNKEMEELDKRR